MSITYAQKNKNVVQTKCESSVSIIDSSSQSESLQRKADMANNAAQRAVAQRPNNTGMPDNLKFGIESLSGFSMDDVRVHYNSSKPATVQALAYTQGTDIHVAPDQEKYLPHEAWHVAQQMAGRVSPTTNINGMPVNDNAALEHEADVMGEKAVQKADDKSPQKIESYSNVIQCDNDPAYFETANDEGCDNSRYYVDTVGYMRIAPINAFRSPNQEYHAGSRNFVYYKDGNDRNMGDFLYDVFNGKIIIGEGTIIKIDESVKNLLENYLMHAPTQEECVFFNYQNFFDDIFVLPNDQERNQKVNDRIKELIERGSLNRYISKKAKEGLAPFDWFGNTFHSGHPVANDSVSEPKLLADKEKFFYEARHRAASEYARMMWQTLKLEDGREITPEKQMDDFFSWSWEFAINQAEFLGEILYASENCAKQQAKNIGRKEFTKSYFLLLTQEVPVLQNYLEYLKRKNLDSYENFEHFLYPSNVAD